MSKEYRHKNNPPGHHGQEGFDLSCSSFKSRVVDTQLRTLEAAFQAPRRPP